ncbi:hypothetical protein GBAR_LOCUS25266, partial [Geodia barretti]
KAKSSGVSTSDILRTTNWSSSTTFTWFYHRPVQMGQFGRRVLTLRPASSAEEVYRPQKEVWRREIP